MNAVDLFCGCGGLSRGLINAGINVCAAYDAWPQAVDVYRLNFRDHPCFELDLADAAAVSDRIKQFKPDLIAGGPPCQDFSHAGKRTEGQNASLTESFGKIITILSPKYFLMENVDRAQKSNAYIEFRSQVKSAGYSVTERVIDASLVGVPQKRKRFFCVGVKKGEADRIGEYLDRNLSSYSTTIKDYMGEELDVEHYYRHPRNYNRRGIFSIDEPSPTVRGVNRPVPSGYKGHHGDTAPVTNDLRPLTTNERARIQTFPKSFIFEGTKTALEQMIGNAVPVGLAKYIGASIMSYEATSFSSSNRSTANVDNYEFTTWLQEEHDLRPRSASDIASRYKRFRALTGNRSFLDSHEAIFYLERSSEFSILPKTVQSQLRRAIKLSFEFLSTFQIEIELEN